MHGYPQFSFWIPKAHAKFCFLCIVLNRTKNIPVRVSRDAQNVYAVTIVGTVLKTTCMYYIFPFESKKNKFYSVVKIWGDIFQGKL